MVPGVVKPHSMPSRKKEKAHNSVQARTLSWAFFCGRDRVMIQKKSHLSSRGSGSGKGEPLFFILTKIGSLIQFAFTIGTWRSLEAHLNGVQGVGGSNPLVPTTYKRGLPHHAPGREHDGVTLVSLLNQDKSNSDYGYDEYGQIVSQT